MVPTSHEALVENLRNATTAEGLLAATAALAQAPIAATAPVLVEVLGYNNPGAAVTAVDGLIRLGTAAVPALLELDPQNYGARAWAVRALAGIGDVRGLELLVEALGTDVAASVRRAAARGLGNLALGRLDPAEQTSVQERCLEALLAATSDGEWVVRYAVAVGLEGLARGLRPQDRAMEQLRHGLVALCEAADDNPPVVCLRAKVALSRLDPP
ncbi:MAG: HEAT repeat domain-containing protein [Cyanobacteria bacterium M_surface_10_m2_119]|nr:HEAT repeat domain-containing protein [Cyanobacteria bacterium M_surface_10_m2_119]